MLAPVHWVNWIEVLPVLVGSAYSVYTNGVEPISHIPPVSPSKRPTSNEDIVAGAEIFIEIVDPASVS